MQAGPAIGRHQLGTHLRQLRIARSMRIEDAAAKLGVAPSTLCRIENGRAPTRIVYLATLLDLYGVDDPGQREQLTEMAVAGQRKDWWAAYANLLPAGTGTYLGLEAAAEQVRGFAAHAVPGILQTPGYAEAFFTATRPELSAAEVKTLATLQRSRQRMAEQSGNSVELILDESVLLRSVGSAQVMTGQLTHLLTIADDPSITVRVVRLNTVRPVLCPTFTLLRLPDAEDPDIACLESIGGHVDIERRAAEVAALRIMFEALAGSALSPVKSANLIGKYADQRLLSR